MQGHLKVKLDSYREKMRGIYVDRLELCLIVCSLAVDFIMSHFMRKWESICTRFH